MFRIRLILRGLLTGLGFLISKKSYKDYIKLRPFECGFNARLNRRIPFSLQFFLVSLIFVIFDVELILLYPLILGNSSSWDLEVVLMFIFLITFLRLGLFHEWSNNILDWVV